MTAQPVRDAVKSEREKEIESKREEERGANSETKLQSCCIAHGFSAKFHPLSSSSFLFILLLYLLKFADS